MRLIVPKLQRSNFFCFYFLCAVYSIPTNIKILKNVNLTIVIIIFIANVSKMIQRKYINKPDKLKYPSAFDKKRSTDFEIISEKI